VTDWLRRGRTGLIVASQLYPFFILTEEPLSQASGEQEFVEVAKSLKRCLEHMGPWQLTDLSLGLLHVAQRHQTNFLEDRLPGSPRGDRSLIQWLQVETQITASAYCIPDASLIETDSGGRILAEHIVYMHQSVELKRFCPAYFVAVDAQDRAVRVVVRGTLDLNDVFTDLAGHWQPFAGNGHVHEGFLRAAQWLLDDMSALDLLEQTLKHHPGCAPICDFLFIYSLFRWLP
jgi:hypothetical protein